LTLFTVTLLVFVTEQVLFEPGPVVPFPQLLPAAIAGSRVEAKRAAAPTNVAIFFIIIFHLLSMKRYKAYYPLPRIGFQPYPAPGGNSKFS
jgi:hypothetical protein